MIINTENFFFFVKYFNDLFWFDLLIIQSKNSGP